MMMDMRAFGQKITVSRQNRGWTQRQLARQLSVSHQAVSKWEQGAAVPDLETLIAMARLFGVSLDELTSTEPVPPKHFSSMMDRIEMEFEQEEEDVEDFDEEEEDDEEMEDSDDLEEDDDDHGYHPHTHTAHDDDEQGKHGSHMHIDFDFETLKKGKTKDDVDPKLKLLMQIAPFVEREILDEKFRDYLENHHVGSYEHITALAPFVSREVIGEALLSVVNDELDPQILMSLMPFISKNDRMLLMEKMEDKQWMMENLGKIAPFLPKDYLGKLLSEIDF